MKAYNKKAEKKAADKLGESKAVDKVEGKTADKGNKILAKKAGKVVEKKAQIVTGAVWKPLVFTAGYLLALRSISEANFYEEPTMAAPIVASILYLSAVYFGPKYMDNKEPMVISDYVFTYNFYQVILNVWSVVAFILEVRNAGMNIWGNKVDRSENGHRMAFLIWVHYNNKYVELLDTMFMIARKKKEQLSFLHVWHHILILWSWFLVCKYAPGGDTYFGALANSLIHVFMYGYYLMRLCHLPCPFKKYITQMQLTQFVVCMTHACYVIYHNTIQRWLAGVQVFVMLNMLVLFGQFYMKAYNKKAETKAADELGQQKTVKVE